MMLFRSQPSCSVWALVGFEGDRVIGSTSLF